MSEAKQANTQRQTRLLTTLGPLEVDILAIVWEAQRVAVRDVYETLLLQRHIAYTTCMSVMGTLVRKGFLAVDKSASTYRYSAALPAEQVAGRILDEIVAHLWRGDSGAALAHLLGLPQALSAQQTAELRRQAEERFGTKR